MKTVDLFFIVFAVVIIVVFLFNTKKLVELVDFEKANVSHFEQFNFYSEDNPLLTKRLNMITYQVEVIAPTIHGDVQVLEGDWIWVKGNEVRVLREVVR